MCALNLSPPQSLEEIVVQLRAKIRTDTYVCEVRRDNVLTDLLRATKKRAFDPYKKIETWFVGGR